MSRIEPLENRIAPAFVFNFTDVDGDEAIIKVSVGDFASATINKMPAGVVGGEQLLSIDLSSTVFEGANVSITAVRNADLGGDGFVNVGRIIAEVRNLGTISVKGDLGQIDAGSDDSARPAIKSLSVNSLGEFGDASGSGNLQSVINGGLGALTVKSNIRGAFVFVQGGDNGTIGSVKVGGSVIGGAGTNTGGIAATGNIGPIFIGGDLVGGAGAASGQLFSNSVIKSITINGSFLGGSNNFAGIIEGDGGIGSVKIGGRVEAFGAATDTATIYSGGTLGNVTIGRGVIGAGEDSAQIHSFGAMGAVKIGGDLRGGAGANSGRIFTEPGAAMGSVTIGGSLIGGTGNFSGSLKSGGDMGFLTVRGDVIGGGEDSAGVSPGLNLAGVFIGGNLEGGLGLRSARIEGSAQIGKVTIGGNMIGGVGNSSAVVTVQNIDNVESMGAVKIGGSIIGGAGSSTARIIGESIKSISVGGSILAGSGPSSGEIDGGNMSFLRVAGSVDGRGFASGASIEVSEFLPVLSIGGFVGNGNNENSGTIDLDDVGSLVIRGDLEGGSIDLDSAKKLAIGGSIFGGTSARTGWVHVANSVGKLTIGGDIRGGGAVQTGMIEMEQDVVVGTLSIGGGVFGGTSSDSGLVLGGDDSFVSKFTIGGDIVGGNGNVVSDRTFLGYVEVGFIGTMFIGGSVIAGTNPGPMNLEESGGINTVDGGIQSLTIRGSIVGNTTNRVVISALAEDAADSVAFGKIAIGGSVFRGDILGGFEYVDQSFNDAQIGKVTVGGDWIASNLVAGIDGIDGQFGDVNDDAGAASTPIVSKIASITILGAAYGTPANVDNADRYAFTAQFIGSLKVGGTAYPLNGLPHDQNSLSDTLLAVGPTGDLRVREL